MDIRFYQLTTLSLDQALPRLIEKAYDAGFRGVVYFDFEDDLRAVDEALWTFSQMSFIPHGRHDEAYPAEQPFYFTTTDEVPNNPNLLVSASQKEHPEIQKFERVMEVFDGRDPISLHAARERYKSYRARGWSLTYWLQNDDGGWSQG